ncbi:MAG: peptide/nickel transport system substrate-binding protein [Thermomicrobiales bacterium]|nr:peptide/nickel transport system substrate-binding protein [Thermomicrobiales bacterium]
MTSHDKTEHPPIDSTGRMTNLFRSQATRRTVLKTAGALAATPLLTSTARSATAQEDTTLQVVTGSDPGVLDPHGVNAAVSEATVVFGQIFETLVDVAFTEGSQPSFIPQLATEWTSVDELTWEFKLREGVTFHNGEPFTADAVKFSVERIRNPEMKSPATQYLPASLDRVDVVDPLTVRVVTKSPYPLTVLSFSRLRIVPPLYVEEQGAEGFGKAPVGTGPFKFVEWVKDDHTTLERNDDYWGGASAISRIVFQPRPEPSARTAALLSGEADIVTLVPISDVQSIADSSELAVAEVPSIRAMFVELDSIGDTPLKDVRVRQALNYAVDKDELIEFLLEGHGVKLDGQLPTKQYFGHNPNLQAYPYDPDKAKALLAEAGYGDGFDITLRGPVGRYMADKELTEAIAGKLAEVGVRATVDVTEWSVYIGKLYERNLAPMFLLGWAPLPDTLGMLTLNLCSSVVNYHCNQEYDDLVAEANTTVDEAARSELYNQATQWLYDNPPCIFLHQQMNIYGVNKRVQGFTPYPDEFFRLNGVTKS